MTLAETILYSEKESQDRTLVFINLGCAAEELRKN